MLRRTLLKAFALPAVLSGRGKEMPFGNAVGEGFVNPGVVVAKKVIVEGPQNGVFVYSGSSPTSGTLVDSLSSGGFTDAAGNLVLNGTASYINTGASAFLAVCLNGAQVIWFTAPTEAGPWTQIASISVGTLGNMNINLANKLSFGFNGGATIGTVPQSGGSSITTVAQVVTVLENMGLLTP